MGFPTLLLKRNGTMVVLNNNNNNNKNRLQFRALLKYFQMKLYAI